VVGPRFQQLVGCPIDDLPVGVNMDEKKNVEAMILKKGNDINIYKRRRRRRRKRNS
jgi:hypothetical protein